MRTRTVPRAQARTYRLRSDEFEAASFAAAGRGHWDVAVANAVHSAISLADALAVWYLGRRNASPAHADAVSVFRDLAASIDARELDRNGRHLAALLELKDAAEYEERRLRESDWARAADHLARFRAWGTGKLPG